MIVGVSDTNNKLMEYWHSFEKHDSQIRTFIVSFRGQLGNSLPYPKLTQIYEVVIYALGRPQRIGMIDKKCAFLKL